jgi:hypothetical protein
VDFLFTAHRDRAAARRFLERAIDQHDEPEKITIDKSGANTAAIDSYNAEHEADIEMRQGLRMSSTSLFLGSCGSPFLARVTAWPRAGTGMRARHAA